MLSGSARRRTWRVGPPCLTYCRAQSNLGALTMSALATNARALTAILTIPRTNFLCCPIGTSKLSSLISPLRLIVGRTSRAAPRYGLKCRPACVSTECVSRLKKISGLLSARRPKTFPRLSISGALPPFLGIRCISVRKSKSAATIWSRCARPLLQPLQTTVPGKVILAGQPSASGNMCSTSASNVGFKHQMQRFAFIGV